MGYRKAYFHITSKYKYNEGWANDETAAEAFQAETRRLFQEDGWTIQTSENSAISDTAVKGQQDLYLHPMNFSGVILEEEVPKIKALLAKASTFRCQGANCYEEYLDLSDEDYWALLESQKDAITDAILKRYKTSRRNLYVAGDATEGIAREFTVHRLCDKDGKRNKAVPYVKQLTESMIAAGRLLTIQTKRGTGIRTATDKEWQERNIFPVDKDFLSRLAD